MRTRGRQSGNELELIAGGVIGIVSRPPPPTELSNEQAEEWRAVVDRMPADWFPRETFPLLVAYCRHTVAARHVARLVEQAEAGPTLDLDLYDRLGKMAERESRILASLATRMRLTQHASYDRTRKKGTGGTRKPWEVG